MEFAALSSDGTVESTALAAPEARYGPAFDAWSSERSAGIRGGSAISPKGALTLAAYYAAINVLSTDLACLPIKMFRKRKSGGRDEVTDDPRSDLLAVSPDGETTSMRMRQALLGHCFGWGNGYAEIEFSGGQVSGLYLLDPTVEASRRSQDKKLYYRLPDGSTRPPYKMLHLAGFGYDGLCGYSPARLMQQTIRLGKNAETFGAAFFDNGITASGHFEAPHKYDKDAADAFRNEMNAMHAGAGNAHRFMVLWNNWKWTQTTIPPEEAQFLETRQFQVLEIARMFRLPPHKLGDYSQSHLSNIEESNIDYMTTVLMPWCESMEQEYNRKLFTQAERLRGYYVEHQMEAFLRGNSASRGAWYQTMFGLGLYTINTIAAKENMNPIGDVGDERFLTVQAQPLSTLLNPPAPPPAPAPAANGQPAEAPVPAVNGQRFQPVANGVAALVHGGSSRFNPNHGADGKFSGGGGGHFAGIAPATTYTGSKIVVEESEPKSASDRKQLTAAEAKGQTAIHIRDTPDIKVTTSEHGTILTAGEKRTATVTPTGDGTGWKYTPHDIDNGMPLTGKDVQTFDSRKRAEKEAMAHTKWVQKYDSRQARINTKNPEDVLAKGGSAHLYYYGDKSILALGQQNAPKDKTTSKWTTTYRILKKPEG